MNKFWRMAILLAIIDKNRASAFLHIYTYIVKILSLEANNNYAQKQRNYFMGI